MHGTRILRLRLGDYGLISEPVEGHFGIRLDSERYSPMAHLAVAVDELQYPRQQASQGVGG